MKWSTQKINEIHKYLVDNSTLNISSIMRELRINSILDDSEVGEFPYHTEGEFIKVPFIKKPFIQFDYTTEELEFIAELKSDATLLSQFIQISDRNGGTVDFNLYTGQQNFVKKYTINKFNVVKHSRQVGMSHLMTLIVLHYITTNHDKSVVWICENYKGDFDRFMSFLSCLPFYISPGVVDLNDKQKIKKILFDNGCQIIFTKSVTNNIGDFVVIDNAGFIELNKTLTLLLPRLSMMVGTQCFIVSSSNKKSYFEQIFQADNNWNKITMNWDIVPDRDSKWVLETTHQIGGYQRFLEEYDVEDNTSKLRDLTIDLLNDSK